MSENNNDKRLFLLDAMALIYRAYFAMIRNPLINSKGLNVSAIRGFTSTLYELIRNEKPTHIAVVFDTSAPTLRSESFAEYKANREETPPDIIQSIPYIKEIVKAFNIPALELDGYEADDIIGTLAKKAEKDGYEVYMVTPDKDFGQLVSDKVFIYKPPYQGRGGFEKIGPEEVKARWGLDRVEQVIDLLGLMGDKVDNIPGVPGVGEKTAIKLLKQYGSVEGIIEHLDELKGKLKERFEENKDQALLSKELATIDTHVPIIWDEEDLVMSEPNREKLAEIFNELEFRTMGQRILGEEFMLAKPESSGQMNLFGSEAGKKMVSASAEAAEGKNMENTEHRYEMVQSEKEITELLKRLQKVKEYSFDTETSGLNALEDRLVGLSFSTAKGEGFYVPAPTDEAAAQKLLRHFSEIFTSESQLKIAQNAKFDILVLRQAGVAVNPPLFDTMIAHYLIEPDMKHSMDYLAEKYLGYIPVSIEKLIGKRGKNQLSMADLSAEEIKDYAAEDADVTFQLKEALEPKLHELEVADLFYNVEMPLVSVLADMEYEGINLDVEFLQEFSKELETDIIRLRKEIHELAGVEFNVDSPKQLSEVLFVKLKIPYTGRKTKTGKFSTGEDILSRLADEYEIARKVLEYRELVKLRSTYVEALPKLINKRTGRIHTTFNQAVANTGRLSSANPNLQNIPIRTEKGQRVRKAFIPRSEEYRIVSADYSQIELRIIASLSGDENMKEAFSRGEDIHASTAAKIFNVPLEEVSREMRRKAKAVNFGIAYGQTAFGLAQTLNISRTEAAEIIKNYFEKFPGIKRFMDESIEFAREHGYVKTILGRRRYLPEINSRNAAVRNFAERNAINMPIQGSAADIIKVAMVNLHRAMTEAGMQSKMVLQVHDELVFDAPLSEMEQLIPLIKDKMENAITMDVPLVVEIGSGRNWLEAH